MHGPDGVDYPNAMKYLEVEPLQKLVYDHGRSDDSPPLFRVTVTFSEVAGKTQMVMISTLPTPEAAREMARFVKRAGGTTTWDRLAEHLAYTATGAQRFVLNRTFEAPIERVFEHWTKPELLSQWLAPAGTSMRFLRSDLAVGKSTLFAMTTPQGTFYVRSDYLAIEAPHRIVYAQQFVDAHETLAKAPGADVWPPTLLMTIGLVEETPERTRVTVTCEAYGEANPAEIEAFVNERGGMSMGWSGSFDALESLVEPSMR